MRIVLTLKSNIASCQTELLSRTLYNIMTVNFSMEIGREPWSSIKDISGRLGTQACGIMDPNKVHFKFVISSLLN